MAVLTFRGTAFELLATDDWIPAPPPPETLESRRPIPYSGGIVIVDDGGPMLRVWSVEIRVLAANVAAMEANLRQIGSLVTNDGTFAHSKLSKLTNRRSTPGRAYTAYSAEWIVSS